MEEERRLFYVGMTRSKYKLFCSYAYKRHDKTKKPSRFLFEAKAGANKNLGKFTWLDGQLDENQKPEIKKPNHNQS